MSRTVEDQTNEGKTDSGEIEVEMRQMHAFGPWGDVEMNFTRAQFTHSAKRKIGPSFTVNPFSCPFSCTSTANLQPFTSLAIVHIHCSHSYL